MNRLAALGAGILLAIGPAAMAAAQSLQTATVRFERNVTDRDVEVVFEVTGGEQGLSSLVIRGPDGRVVVNATAPDASTMGIRQFVLESPEPGDAAALRAAYPEGVYTFEATDHAGTTYRSRATLSHVLPKAATVMHPEDRSEDVDPASLTMEWLAVRGAAGFVVEVEQEDSPKVVKVTLPATATRFTLPEGFLVPGGQYRYAIVTVMENGNASAIESEFATAVAGGARASAKAGCDAGEPADEFSTKVGPLLSQVEGAGFPDAANLASWSTRQQDIRTRLGQILELSGKDRTRRQAAVEALLAAEALALDDASARRLIDRSRGEVRAWTRRTLNDYAVSGATEADRRLVGPGLITKLKSAWGNVKVEHPMRVLPIYRKYAAALRGLATTGRPASCG